MRQPLNSVNINELKVPSNKTTVNFLKYVTYFGPNGQSSGFTFFYIFVYGNIARRSLWRLTCKDCAFEFRRLYECLSIMNVLCCKAYVIGRSLVQGSATSLCVCACVCVIKCGQVQQ